MSNICLVKDNDKMLWVPCFSVVKVFIVIVWKIVFAIHHSNFVGKDFAEHEKNRKIYTKACFCVLITTDMEELFMNVNFILFYAYIHTFTKVHFYHIFKFNDFLLKLKWRNIFYIYINIYIHNKRMYIKYLTVFKLLEYNIFKSYSNFVNVFFSCLGVNYTSHTSRANR